MCFFCNLFNFLVNRKCLTLAKLCFTSIARRCKFAHIQALTSSFLLNSLWVFILSIFIILVYLFLLLFLPQLRFVICWSTIFVKHSNIPYQTSSQTVFASKLAHCHLSVVSGASGYSDSKLFSFLEIMWYVFLPGSNTKH